MEPPAPSLSGPPDPAARLLAVLDGLDLTSADGRAGIRTLLAEIERLSRRHPPARRLDRAEAGGLAARIDARLTTCI